MSGLDYSSLCDKAYERLLDEILTGVRKAGDKLGEEKLAQEFSISRTPAREALQRLIQEGLVEQKPRCGCFVKKMEYADIVDVFECRQKLECLALEEGFENIDRDAIEDAKALLDASDKAPVAVGLSLSLQADDAMHQAIVSSCSNKTLGDLIQRVQIKTHPFRKHRTLKKSQLKEINDERRTLLDALAGGNKERALKLIGEHILQGIPSEF